MSELAIKNGQTANPTIPGWIRYLVAAYPAASVNKRTYFILEEHFASVESSRMMTAVRRHVAQSKWWPTVAELAALVASQEVEDIEAMHLEKLERAAVSQTRQELLEAVYAGEYEPSAWQDFATSCASLGLEFNAAWARRRMAAFAEMA